MESVWQDFRYAVRVLVKNPGFTAVAVTVLGLGIGANTSIFTLTNALLLRPIQAEAPHELVALFSKHTTRPDSFRSFSYPNFEDIREQNTTFTSLMAHDLTMVGVTEGESTRRVFAELASHDYFDTFGVSPFRGRFFTAAEEAPGSGVPVVVVSYEHWRRSGQDPELIGQTLIINGEPLTIVGIAPRHFTGCTALLSPSIYLPLGLHDLLTNPAFADGDGKLADRDNHTLFLIGRLRPGLTAEDADAQLGVLAARMRETFPSINEDQTIIVGPVSRLSISTDPADEDGQLSLVFVLLLGMTGIVLLIACINLANMLLARGAARRKEFAIRAAIGGGQGRILRQLLTEGLLLAALGGVAGLVIAVWVNNLLAASMQELLALNSLSMDIVLRSTPDGRVLLATAVFCVLGTLFFGFGPAWRQSRPDVMGDLKDHSGEELAKGGWRGAFGGRNLLVVSQIALSLALLTAAGLFIRGALRAANVDPGFSTQNGLLAEVDPGLVGYDEPRSQDLYRRLNERLRGIPGIESASLAATVPFGAVSSGKRVRRSEDLPQSAGGGAGEIETIAATSNIVGVDYFETLGVRIRSGRGFTLAETESDSGPPVAIVDELLASQLWPEQPCGSRNTPASAPAMLNQRMIAEATPRPIAAPRAASSAVSKRSWRASRKRVPPNADRTAISVRRSAPFTSSRLATLAQHNSKRNPAPTSKARTEPEKSSPMYSSWKVLSTGSTPSLVSGNSLASELPSAANSARAASSSTPSRNRPNTSSLPLPRSTAFRSIRRGIQNCSAMGNPKPGTITPTTVCAAPFNRTVAPIRSSSASNLLVQVACDSSTSGSSLASSASSKTRPRRAPTRSNRSVAAFRNTPVRRSAGPSSLSTTATAST